MNGKKQKKKKHHQLEVSEVMGVSPNHPVVMDDNLSIETHGDLGILMLGKPASGYIPFIISN